MNLQRMKVVEEYDEEDSMVDEEGEDDDEAHESVTAAAI
jgi:hypothetical protein